jgi:hypothetical protein
MAIHIATATLNFSYGHAAAKSPEWIASAIERGGFDGIEWSDVPNIHPRSIAARGVAVYLAKHGLVTSMQQSWQSTAYGELPQVFRDAKAENGAIKGLLATAKQAALIAGLPRLPESLDKLEPIQAAAGKKLAVVAHPNEQHLGNKPRPGANVDYPTIRAAGSFAALRFQPTAELLDAWGVLSANPEQTVDDMLSVMEGHGFDQVAFDSHHAYMERGGKKLPDPARMAAQLVKRGRMDELQLCWRPDFGGDANELHAALSGHLGDTHQGEVLYAVHSNLNLGDDQYIVVETPADAFSDTLLREFDLPDYISGQQLLTSTIRGALPRLI